MNRIKPALAIAFVLVATTSSIELAQAQISPNQEVASEQRKPPVPPGRPDDREPAGTRGPAQQPGYSSESNQGVPSSDNIAPLYSRLVTQWYIPVIVLGGILGIAGFWFIDQRSKSKG